MEEVNVWALRQNAGFLLGYIHSAIENVIFSVSQSYETLRMSIFEKIIAAFTYSTDHTVKTLSVW